MYETNNTRKLQPVSRDITNEYIQRLKKYFVISESLQPNFYNAVYRICEKPSLLRNATSKSLGLKEQKSCRFCAEIVDGPMGLDIYYAFFYTTVPLRMRSVKGLVKFLALRILLSENHIKDFPF